MIAGVLCACGDGYRSLNEQSEIVARGARSWLDAHALVCPLNARPRALRGDPFDAWVETHVEQWIEPELPGMREGEDAS